MASDPDPGTDGYTTRQVALRIGVDPVPPILTLALMVRVGNSDCQEELPANAIRTEAECRCPRWPPPPIGDVAIRVKVRVRVRVRTRHPLLRVMQRWQWNL